MKDWLHCPRCAARLHSGDDEANPSVHCPSCGFARWLNPLPTTVAVIAGPDGRVLLLQRAHEPRRGTWDAVGGFLAAFETAEECLRREAIEEIGIEPQIESFIGTFTSIYGDTGLRTIGLAFKCRIDEVDPKLSLSAENDHYGWFDLNDLPEIAFGDVLAALHAVRDDER